MLAAFAFTDRVRPVVQMGIGDVRVDTGQSLWDRARWDQADARWAGTEPTWLDITCDVIGITLQYGHARTTDRFVVGEARLTVDNASGWADPQPPPDTPGVLYVRPGRALRVGVEHAEHGLRWLWRGIVDGLDPLYDPVEPDIVAFSCIDALGEVNRVKLAAQPAAVGAGENATARVNRILDLAMWPASKRDVRESATTLIGDDLGGQVADMLGQTADSIGGAVYGDTEGRVVLRNRDWQTYVPGTPPDATIGNLSEPADVVYGPDDVVFGGSDVVFGTVGDVCPTRWVRPFERADIATRVLLNREGADTPARVYDDPAWFPVYGIEPYERLDLLTEHDADLDRQGDRLLATRGATTAPRVRSVSLDAATAANVIDLLYSLDVHLPSRYRCRLQLNRGLVFDDEYFAVSVRHELTPARWAAEINLDVARPYAATGGRWDTNRGWDRTVWSEPPALALIGAA